MASNQNALSEQIVRAATLHNVSMAVAESCTGGLVCSAITDIPGASEVFLGGVVAYSNAAKSGILGVCPELLRADGAVSARVAEAMAIGVMSVFESKVGVAITGIAGPGGATRDKPVGLVWIAIASRSESVIHVRSECQNFGKERHVIRAASVEHALDVLFGEIVSFKD